MNRKNYGMTLVEILIAMAIASLMTLTGWRAVDALQTSRDRVVAEAAQWQRVDDFFVTLEADLRRASFTEFSGTANGLMLVQPALDGGPDVSTVRYQLAELAQTDQNSAAGAAKLAMQRTVANDTLSLAETQSLSLAYSVDGTTFSATATAYPRALRVTLLPAGAAAPVERLFALQ
jgi:prepilin-type N-terminal cleavage/methylation domain-containing protein